MGLADRDYHRTEPASSGFLSRLPPVVRWLLLVNVGIFFIDMFLEHKFLNFGAFAIQSAIFDFRIWEFITFQFLHGSLGHLLFNSLGLYFFGPWMERWWGSKKFLLFYLLCGCAGAALFALLTMTGFLPEKMIPLNKAIQMGLDCSVVVDGMVALPRKLHTIIGASAGIYGIFIGVAVIAPNLRVALLFPPIELSMRQLAIALLVIASGAIILSWGGNEGGEAGHLGGAILGFILVRHPQLLGFTIPRPPRPRRPYKPKLRPRSDALLEQDNAVDLILDKISREGFQSLTTEERDFLHKASQGKKTDS